MKLAKGCMLAQVLYFFKKTNVDAKVSILVHETCKNITNFNLELKEMVVMFLLQLNKMLILLLKIKTNLTQILWLN